MISLEVQHAGFSYGKHSVFSDINFMLTSSDVMAILGANGSGKTTLLKCLSKIINLDSGQILLDGKKIQEYDSKDFFKQVAYVPQTKRPPFGFTALELVQMGRNAHLGFIQEPSDEDTQIALESLEKCGILDLKDKTCTQMSGGEFQLVMLARALATKPRLLIVDEGESNLDIRNQSIIMDLLQQFALNGMIVVMSTHSLQNALKISNKALLLGKERKPLFGDSKSIICEKNINEYFGLKSSLL